MFQVNIYQGTMTLLQKHFAQPQPPATGGLEVRVTCRQEQAWEDGLVLREIVKAYLPHLSTAQQTVLEQKHTYALHFLLPESFGEPHTTDDENDPRARLISHMTHNWYLVRSLRARLQELLADLCAIYPLTLWVADTCALDWTTQRLLSVFRWNHPYARLHLHIGVAQNVRLQPKDNHSIKWCPDSVDTCDLLMALDLQQDLQPVALTEENQTTGPPTNGSVTAAIPQHLPASPAALSSLQQLMTQLAQWQQLTGDEQETVTRNAYQSILHALQYFAFRTVIKLGRCWLDAAMTTVTSQQTAEVHACMALAAHNLQFIEDHNEQLDQWITQHLQQAYRLNQDATLAAALAYRLAVAYGRRRKDFSQALKWSTQAVTLADELIHQAPQLHAAIQQYQSAWAHNIHAYCLSKHPTRRHQAGAAIERSITLIDQARNNSHSLPGSEREYWHDDALMSQCVMLINRSTLGIFKRDNLDHIAWRQQIFPHYHLQDQQVLGFESRHWIKFFQHNLLPLEALRWAETYYTVSFHRHDLSHVLQSAGDQIWVCYRLGLSERARAQYQSYYRRHSKWCPHPQVEALLHPQNAGADWYSLAWVLTRSGDHHSLENFLALQVHSPHSHTPLSALSLVAMRGVSHSIKQDRHSAEQAFNQAIDIANEVGELSAFIRLVRLAGYASERQGDYSSAQEHYQQIIQQIPHDSSLADETLFIVVRWLKLNIAGIHITPPASIHPPASDNHALWASWLMRVVQAFPDALQRMEAWWYLADLIELISQPFFTQHTDAITDAQLDTLIWCASQRSDSQAQLEKLFNNLPASKRAETHTRLKQKLNELSFKLDGVISSTSYQYLQQRFHGMLAVLASTNASPKTVPAPVHAQAAIVNHA